MQTDFRLGYSKRQGMIPDTVRIFAVASVTAIIGRGGIAGVYEIQNGWFGLAIDIFRFPGDLTFLCFP